MYRQLMDPKNMPDQQPVQHDAKIVTWLLVLMHTGLLLLGCYCQAAWHAHYRPSCCQACAHKVVLRRRTWWLANTIMHEVKPP
jgi:hypothetical protein